MCRFGEKRLQGYSHIYPLRQMLIDNIALSTAEFKGVGGFQDAWSTRKNYEEYHSIQVSVYKRFTDMPPLAVGFLCVAARPHGLTAGFKRCTPPAGTCCPAASSRLARKLGIGKCFVRCRLRFYRSGARYRKGIPETFRCNSRVILTIESNCYEANYADYIGEKLRNTFGVERIDWM